MPLRLKRPRKEAVPKKQRQQAACSSPAASSVCRVYPDTLHCLFQGDALEPFMVFRKRKVAEAVLAAETLGKPHRDYHMAEYVIKPNPSHHAEPRLRGDSVDGVVRREE